MPDLIKTLSDNNPRSQLVKEILDTIPDAYKENAQKHLSEIIDALAAENILTPRTLAYALATTQHESGFAPIEEVDGREQARRLGYGGGEDYYGRGFIQLTHRQNYENMDKRLGLNGELVKNPNLALRPDIAARIMAAFMKDNGVVALAEKGDFLGARGPINGTDKAQEISQYAQNYLKSIKPELTQNVFQEYQNKVKPAPVVAAMPQNKAVPAPDLSSNREMSSSGQLINFVEKNANITQRFGNKNEQLYKDVGGANRGTDYDVAENTPLVAPRQLTVVDAQTEGWNTGWGKNVLLKDNQTGETFRLSHLNDIYVKPGQMLNPGQKFGLSGRTDRTTGPHLDVEYTTPQGQLADIEQKYPTPQIGNQLATQGLQQQNLLSIRPKPPQTTAVGGPSGSSRNMSSNSPRGVSGVVSSQPSAIRAAAPQTKFYTVRPGDTPGAIAQRYLGNAGRWQEIYKGDPRKMQIGTKLRIA